MSTTPIRLPLPGEQVLQLSPADAAEAATTWLRRPNLFPGRALTAPTLDARSHWAAGHVVQRGQAFTPGIAQGLELDYVITPPTETGARPTVRLHIAAGSGLAASGEDVWLARPIEVDFYGLPVVVPADLPDGGGGGTGALRNRIIGPSLGEFLSSNPGTLPLAGILVLQPVAVDVAGIDPLDPCERCGCAEGNVSFEDWRLADAVRLLWYAWPVEWPALPAPGPRLRNTLAYRVFDAERALTPDGMLPWEEFGVPIGLIGVDAAFVPTFADRAAVARAGGLAQLSRLQLAGGGAGAITPQARLAPLWQAQIEQLAEQVAEFGDTAPPPADLAAAFGRLPPCGLLPTNVFDRTTRSSGFFPAAFDLDAVPVPLEQLDLAIREAAPLAPLDFSLGERVRVLVPVSQASWEPRLLLTEVIDPLFQQTLDGYLLARSRALGARQGLRLSTATLRQAIDATPPTVPDIATDPDALETESFAPWGPPPNAGGHRARALPGLHQHLFDGATAAIIPAVGAPLYAWAYLDADDPPRTLMLQWFSGNWEHRAYWGEDLVPWGTNGTESRRRIGDLPPAGRWLRLEIPPEAVGLADRSVSGMAFTMVDGRAAFGPSGRITAGVETPWFAATLPAGAVQHGNYAWEFLTPNGLWSPFEASFGLVNAPPGAAAPTPAGVSSIVQGLLGNPALAVLSNHERSQLTVRGLQGFIDYLNSRTTRADDVIDYGFIKIQTDIYRVRQLVLNTTNATRLAVSPTLAGIAQAETAVASQQQISTFFDQLRNTTTTAPRETLPPVAARAGLNAGNFALNATDIALDTQLRQVGTANFLAQDLTLDTGITPVKATYTPIDITNAAPVVGSLNLRTLSIAERLVQPKAQEARDYSGASRQEAVNRLLVLADTLRDEDRVSPTAEGETSGLFADLSVFATRDDPFLENDEVANATRRRPFSAFLDRANRSRLLSLMLQPRIHTDPQGNPIDGDESLHFSDATDTSDTSVALLRQVEGRVRRYRDAISACQQALTSLRADYSQALARGQAWSIQLAEARHDVAVTRALIDEEQTRLEAINTRRAAVLAGEVRFLAYIRPRDADILLTPPVRNLDPGLIDPPVPACLRSHPDVPDELVQMLAVVREAPAAWFGQGTRWFDDLQRIDLLVRAVQTTQLRTRLAAARPVASNTLTGLAGAISRIGSKQSQAVSLVRANALQVDTTRLAALTWQGAFQQAVQVVSLGDLISGEHGSTIAARRAAAFYDKFAQICACLYAEFSAVPPAIRLGWATLLSEFDVAPNLRNLASLPRWAELDYIDRRQMQSYADWLFSQASTSVAQAQGLINDVVRMAILLASHAPVDRIIAGRLPRPVTARPGLRIPLVALDPARLRIGMEAVIYRASTVVARAVVEDIGGGEVSARVVHTATASVDLDESVRVQFADTARIGFTARAVSAPR